MSDYLPFLVIGVTVGAVYGVAAMGLVLSYKTSGVFNFGHGAIAAAAAIVFYELHQVRGLPWPLALVVAVLGFGVIAGLAMELLARGLAATPTSSKIVATVGLIVGIPAAIALLYGPAALSFQSFLPASTALTLSGVAITYQTLIILAFGVLSAVGLFVLFRSTRLGTAMRAVVDDPDLLDMTGISPVRVRRIAWLIGCCFAASSGVLFASTQQQLDPILLALLVVQAFGAAAIGGFTSLPLAFAGGVGIGIVQAIISKESGSIPALRGLDTNVPFLVLFILLLVLPRHRLVELGQRVIPRVGARRPVLPARARVVGAVAVGLAALAVPHLVGIHLASWNTALALVVLYLSLGLLTRTSGQISLCQVGFAAIGGTSMAHLLSGGVPWPLALVLAGLVVVPVGALISIPAIRLSGLYLGLATLGFGILLAQYFYTKDFMFGLRGLATSRPGFAESDVAYYYVLLAVAVASIALVMTIERTRLGRLLRGLADSPTALATLGVSINVTRVLVFCLSAFLAGISGALTACIFRTISIDSFNYVQSLVILAVLVIAGVRTISAAIIAPLISTLPPAYISNANVAFWLQLAFGLIAIVVSLLSQGRFSDLCSSATARARERRGAAPSRLRRRATVVLADLT